MGKHVLCAGWEDEGVVKLLPLSLAFGICAGAFQGYASHSPLSFRNHLLTFRERWMGTFFFTNFSLFKIPQIESNQALWKPWSPSSTRQTPSPAGCPQRCPGRATQPSC